MQFCEIKANKQSIGFSYNQKTFTNHQISLNKGDTFYLLSDGCADQFGGAKGKELMKRQFKQLLISNAKKTDS